MPSTNRTFPLYSSPGIKQPPDGTTFEGTFYTQGQHVRFYRDLPMTMGGYSLLDGSSLTPYRGQMYINYYNNYYTLFAGNQNQLCTLTFDVNGASGVLNTARTPSGLTSDPNNQWQFTAMQYNPGGYTAIVAHCAPNLNQSSSTNTPVYWGNINGTAPLVPIVDSGANDNTTLVQTYQTAIASGSTTIVGHLNSTAAGDLLIVVVSDASGSTAPTITDNQSSTYTLIDSGSDTWVFYTANTAANITSVTATFSGTDEKAIIIQEWSGLITSGPLDVHVHNTYASAATTQSSGATATTAQNNELVIGWLKATGSAAPVPTAGLNFLNFSTQAFVTTPNAIAIESMNVFSTGGQNVSFNSLSSSTSGTVGAITFKLPVTTIEVSGGIVGVYPYLFVYGNNGLIQWSNPGNLTDFSGSIFEGIVTNLGGSNNISAQKVLLGMEDRSAGANAPAACFWTLDKFVRVNYVGGASIFSFSSLPGYEGLFSTNCVVEMDGVYYWIGNNCFTVYTGTLSKLPNNQTLLYFFNNVNMAQSQKVWGTKVPMFNEIWWFFPSGTSTECNEAIIYNTAENFWYSTSLPRSAGIYSTMFPSPIWASTVSVNPTETTYPLWQHEVGTDEVISAGQSYAIPKSITTCEYSYNGSNPNGIPGGLDGAVQSVKLTLDMLQTGDLTLTLLGKKFARQAEYDTVNYTITPETQYLDLEFQNWENLIQIESNTIGGSFMFGRTMWLIDPESGDNDT